MSASLLRPRPGIVKPGIRRRGLRHTTTGLALGGVLAVRAAPMAAAPKRRSARQSGIQEGWRSC
jgi:hypothetical protein